MSCATLGPVWLSVSACSNNMPWSVVSAGLWSHAAAGVTALSAAKRGLHVKLVGQEGLTTLESDHALELLK